MYKYLDGIKTPEDVKKLNIDEANILSAEIRDFLIDSVSKTGGHLASNLGVVELTVSLLHAFDFPKDKVIWDVGHQSYVYKLLTGRKDRFHTLRQFGGLAGFPKTSESEFDSFNTGHSSTSVSAALGIAKANAINGNDAHTIAVIGDGALSGGMAIEALCDAGSLNRNFIVILNDNNMSISKSVGGFTKHLTKLRAVPAYSLFKARVYNTFSKLPLGEQINRFLKRFKDMIKHLMIGTTMFEDMGFNYLGPIDGHDIETLTIMLNRAKELNCPVLLHVITTKGKGYSFAENAPSLYHGVSTFEAKKGIDTGKKNPTYSRIAGNTLCSLAEKDDKVCVVTAAMSEGTGTDEFSIKYPDRFFDVSIAEQHAVTFASGLAISGLLPFVVIYSSFLQRAYDQILHDVCLQNLDVTFCIDRAGIVGEDGETHHGLFDISYLSSMPNMMVLAPANFKELEQMMQYASSEKRRGPVAIRYPRGYIQNEYESKDDFKPYAHQIISGGEKVCIICAGIMTAVGERVSSLLAEKSINPTLVNLRTISPLDKDFIIQMANTHDVIVTIEDGVTIGGVGEKIAAIICENEISCKCLIKGYPSVVTHGSPKELRRLHGLDEETIFDEVLNKL